MTRKHIVTGIVLKRQDHAETDRILTIMSKEFGKIVLIAKGVRTATSRRQGHLEIFSHIRASFHKGAGMGVLTEVETIDQFDTLSESWELLGSAFHISEIVDRLLPDEEHNEKIYDVLLRFLQAIVQETRPEQQEYIVRLCEQTLLEMLGYWDTESFGEYRQVKDKHSTKSRNIAYIQGILERELKSIKIFDGAQPDPLYLKDH